MDHAYALQICLRFCLRHAHVAAVFAYIGHISILLAGSADTQSCVTCGFSYAPLLTTQLLPRMQRDALEHCEHGNTHHASSC